LEIGIEAKKFLKINSKISLDLWIKRVYLCNPLTTRSREREFIRRDFDEVTK